ncbi:MAG: hypothetical protein ACI4XB_09310 [Ruminococcus sp.]
MTGGIGADGMFRLPVSLFLLIMIFPEQQKNLNEIPPITTRWKLHHLQALIREIIAIAEQNYPNPLPRCFQFCRTIDKNITICIENHYTDVDALIEYIQEDWKSAMHSHTGLPEYYLQVIDKSQKLTRQNQKISKLIRKIDKLILKLVN